MEISALPQQNTSLEEGYMYLSEGMSCRVSRLPPSRSLALFAEGRQSMVASPVRPCSQGMGFKLLSCYCYVFPRNAMECLSTGTTMLLGTDGEP
jgi:hypothetical protein